MAVCSAVFPVAQSISPINTVVGSIDPKLEEYQPSSGSDSPQCSDQEASLGSSNDAESSLVPGPALQVSSALFAPSLHETFGPRWNASFARWGPSLVISSQMVMERACSSNLTVLRWNAGKSSDA